MTPRTAMILAAGRGSRLRTLTQTTPKPLLPVNGKPLLHWQLEALQRAGIERCVINLHHLGEQIEASVGNGETFGLHIEYSRETDLLETGGGIVNALPRLSDEFLVLNGDIWTDFDFATLPPRLSAEIDGHLVVTPKPPSRDQGDLTYADGRIVSRGDAMVYCGISIWRQSAFAGRQVEPFSLRDVIFELIEARRLGAQRFDGVWHDIGTLEEYARLKDPAVAD